MLSPISSTGPSSPAVSFLAGAAAAVAALLPPSVTPAAPVPTARKNLRRFDLIAITPGLCSTNGNLPREALSFQRNRPGHGLPFVNDATAPSPVSPVRPEPAARHRARGPAARPRGASA